MGMILLAFMLRFLQNTLTFSETKSPPTSDIIFLSNPYSQTMTKLASIKLPSYNQDEKKRKEE